MLETVMELELQKSFCNLSLASVVSKESLVFCCILLDTTQAFCFIDWFPHGRNTSGSPECWASLFVHLCLGLGRFSPLNTCPAAVLDQGKNTWDVPCGTGWMYYIASLVRLSLYDEGFSHIANSIWKLLLKCSFCASERLLLSCASWPQVLLLPSVMLPSFPTFGKAWAGQPQSSFCYNPKWSLCIHALSFLVIWSCGQSVMSAVMSCTLLSLINQLLDQACKSFVLASALGTASSLPPLLPFLHKDSKCWNSSCLTRE